MSIMTKNNLNYFRILVIFGIFVIIALIYSASFVSKKVSHFKVVNNETLETFKINACIFLLVQNSDLGVLKGTIEEFEANFNARFNYPYVFLNDVEFTDEFKREVIKRTKSKVEFGVIPSSEWTIPSWIDKQKLDKRLKSSLKRLMYGSKISYHHMCRYYSGFFFRHELTLKYDYYWRIDIHSRYPCRIERDPFRQMVDENKLYRFGIVRGELMHSIPTLWSTINDWLDQDKKHYRRFVPVDNAVKFVAYGQTTNECHFWNNFEIASFHLYRNEIYQDYFNYLDQSGGFYYERWGDAPVHTYFVVLMLQKKQIHHFKDIAYGHDVVYNWPINSKCDNSEVKILKQISNSSEGIIDRCLKKWINAVQGDEGNNTVIKQLKSNVVDFYYFLANRI